MRLKRRRVQCVMDICYDDVDIGLLLKMRRVRENFKKYFQ